MQTANIDILRGATIVPARFFGLEDRLSTAEVKKTTSLVLVRANPQEDICNASQIAGVFLRGRFLSSKELAMLLANIQHLAVSRC